MARIAGVNLPVNKRALVSLTYIHGIGPKFALDILKANGLDHTKRIKDFSEDEISKIRKSIEESYTVEGDLRRVVSQNIKRLKDLGCYRGLRHRRQLPTRGQRTHTNARTRKGRHRSQRAQPSRASPRRPGGPVGKGPAPALRSPKGPRSADPAGFPQVS